MPLHMFACVQLAFCRCMCSLVEYEVVSGLIVVTLLVSCVVIAARLRLLRLRHISAMFRRIQPKPRLQYTRTTPSRTVGHYTRRYRRVTVLVVAQCVWWCALCMTTRLSRTMSCHWLQVTFVSWPACSPWSLLIMLVHKVAASVVKFKRTDAACQ